MTPQAEQPATVSATGHGHYRWPVALCVLAFAAVGIGAGFIIRLDYGPDEPQHLHYAHVMATEGRLPLGTDTHQANHPPLPYLPMALVWRLLGVRQAPMSLPLGPLALARMTPEAVTARRALRVVSTLTSCLTLLLLAWLAAVAGAPPAWRPYLVFIIAAMPMFQYCSSVVNNDPASVLWSTVLCLMLVLRVRHGTSDLRQAAWFGLAVGFGMWIKQTTLFVAPLALWAVWATSPAERRRRHVTAFLLAAVVAGIGWPLRNRLVEGAWFPFFVRPYDQPSPAEVLANPKVLALWGYTILMTFVLPDWATGFINPVVARAITFGGLALLTGVWVYRWRDRRDHPAWLLRNLAVAAFACLFAGVLQFTAMTDWRASISGRYLLNISPWLVTFLAASLPGRSERPRPVVRIELITGVILLLLVDLMWWTLVAAFYAGVARRS